MSVYTCPPVMICGFNRPDYLRQVFERVREIKPAQLFLVLDAPREGNDVDKKKNDACKKIFEGVDWPCEVNRNYAEKNLGCRERMSSGISWALEHVESIIILEDDCVPHIDFFRFCAEMLEMYKNDMRIGMVAGFREHSFLRDRKESYSFSRFTQICGWATWRRAWDKYGKVLENWDIDQAKVALEPIFRNKRLIEQVAKWFDDAYAKRSNSWATVWWMSNVFENFLTIHPAVNLITNIGIVGCHNNKFNPRCHNVQSQGISFPLVHPAHVMPDAIDEQISRDQMTPRSLMSRIAVAVARRFGIVR